MANTISKARKEIFSLTPKELSSKLIDLENQLFHLRMQWTTGQLANTSVLRTVQKDIARVKTAMKQKEIQAAAKQ